jgi:hypothetical protein
VGELIEVMASRGHAASGPYAGIHAFPELGVRFTSTYDLERDLHVVESVGLVPQETIPELSR